MVEEKGRTGPLDADVESFVAWGYVTGIVGRFGLGWGWR
jgi:hypothetical protein